jgi:uncharacterized membrane protein YkvA (DUF1232 family)
VSASSPALRLHSGKGVPEGEARPAEREHPRRGARRTLAATILEIPRYLRLLAGLLGDRRVSPVDKVLVGVALAYVVTPIDLIPDFIPFVGQIDDVFLLVLAVRRLINHAGRRVLLDHWSGDPKAIGLLKLRRVLGAAAFFLPWRTRRRLRRMSRP